jgi:acyl-CoA dehydrogenase
MTMMNEVAAGGGGFAAASTIHINLFGPHPIVVNGTPEQKARWVPSAGVGRGPVLLRLHRAGCRPEHDAHQDLRGKGAGGYVVNGQKVWTSTAQVANKIMLLTRTTKFEIARSQRRHHDLSTPTWIAARSTST